MKYNLLLFDLSDEDRIGLSDLIHRHWILINSMEHITERSLFTCIQNLAQSNIKGTPLQKVDAVNGPLIRFALSSILIFY